ncbi:MAG: L17 family ribosomal protein [Firmicutes bacterium]|nr:L17 family ribosomal protein [Bacillota bacterium]
MAGNRKLNRPTDQRNAVMRGLVTALLANGRIETTEARAKDVRKITEKIITLAVKECDNTVEVKKSVLNEKKQIVEMTFTNDSPSKLHARRQIMSYLYNTPEKPAKGEDKKTFKVRAAEVNNPVVEKLMREIAPKYKARIEEKGQGGGYTRIIKKGPRRGDAAEIVIIELV